MPPVIGPTGVPDLFGVLFWIALIVGVGRFASLIRLGSSLESAGTELGLEHDNVKGIWVSGPLGSMIPGNKERVAGLMAGQLPAFPLFGVGYLRRAIASLRGTWQGRGVTVLEYQYSTGSGRGSTTHTWLC